MTTTTHVTAGTKTCDPIRLLWNIDGWRWSRQFHGALERPLSSSVYETAHCKWKLELLIIKNSERPEEVETMRAALSLIDCDSIPSSVIIRGDLKIGPSRISTYCNQALNGSLFVGEMKYTPRVKYSGFSDALFVSANLNVYVDDKTSEEKEAEIEDDKLQISNLIEDLGSLIDSDFDYDLHIFVDGEEVFGHQAIFAARCSELRSRFFSSKKKKQSVLDVVDCSLEAWKIFQRFVYTSQLSINLSDCVDICTTLLRLAQEYGIECLRDAVSDQLVTILTRDSLFDLIDIFYDFNLKQLQQMSCQIVRSNLNYFRINNKDVLLDNLQRRPELMNVLIDLFYE